MTIFFMALEETKALENTHASDCSSMSFAEFYPELVGEVEHLDYENMYNTLVSIRSCNQSDYPAYNVDLEKKLLHIRKSYQRLERRDVITEPKTEKSNRDINLPDFLCEELEDYFGMLYKCNNDTRLFEVSKHYLQHEMKRGCKESGVKRIRIHDLRHSHVAYLIELGFSPVEIAERMGHESISVTFTYSHPYPSKQKSLADKLNADREKALEQKREDGEDE